LRQPPQNRSSPARAKKPPRHRWQICQLIRTRPRRIFRSRSRSRFHARNRSHIRTVIHLLACSLVRCSCRGSQRDAGPAVIARRGSHARRGDPVPAQRLITACALAQALLGGFCGQQVRRPGAVHHLGQEPPWPGLLLFSATTATPPRWLVVFPAHRSSPR
jgi:hypothetical protein